MTRPGSAGATQVPPLSLVLLAGGDAEELIECLASALSATDHPGGIDFVVVHDGTDRQVHHVLRELEKSATAVLCDPRDGREQAWARGAAAASGEYIALVSTDIRFVAGWLHPLVTALQEGAAASTPSVLRGRSAAALSPPGTGRGVCIVTRRTALENARVTDVLHVPTATVLTTQHDADAGHQRGGSGGFVAPGGGAPSGPVRRLPSTGAAAATTNLHLGCGTNQIENWINIDGDPACAPDLVVDLGKRWPVEDESVDYIYSEHFLEHFDLLTAMRVLHEARRVLKPGGTIRTAMPDLGTVVRDYLGDWRTAWVRNMPEIDSPARMLNAGLRYWGHEYLWDEHELHLRLTQLGFTDVRTVAWGESSDPVLCGVETRAESDLIVEASKA